MDFFLYRDRDDFEVDIVLERGSVAVAGVEVNAAASVTAAGCCGRTDPSEPDLTES